MSKLNFKGSWRSYQKRILDDLSFHLRDDKLHIVAAPGAGKTTLGIEVLSKLNQATLILCPTNTIKNQWKERICSAFLKPEDYNIVSTDLRNPEYITVTTYQALLASFCGQKDEDTNSNTYDEEAEISEEEAESISNSKRFNSKKADEIIKILKDANITVLCFDEAHHLRNEWWKALIYLNENLAPKQTLSLTATPPYDANINEWNRYEELCGEIDEVISIPELVKNGDLCPHQDFIYYSLLKDSEKELIKKQNANIKTFMDELNSDSKLISYLSSSPFLNEPKSYTEQIFDDPDFYVSTASFLKLNNKKINPKFLSLFNAKEHELPKFTQEEAKKFLNGLLYNHCEEFAQIEEKLEHYRNRAKLLGLVYNKRIVLGDNVKIQRKISGSIAKIDSIEEITELEYNSLSTSLRMVILADLIKLNDTDSDSLGVVPIWKRLKNKFRQIPIGVLCGSLILLPKTLEQSIELHVKENDLTEDSLTVSSFNQDEAYMKITPKESAKNKIVGIITEMFNKGEINILIGTQALLGEGWDAPSINSLILSSTVSSYMLSNQMRGRAIRIDKNNPDKISNIWHLASIALPEKTNIFEEIFSESSTNLDEEAKMNALMHDIVSLEKRFEGYEAPSYFDKHEIVSGIDRVKSKDFYHNIEKFGENAFKDFNKSTRELALNRSQTKQWWNDALYLGYGNGQQTMTTGVEAEKLTVNTLKYTSYKEMLFSTFTTFLFVLASVIYSGGFNWGIIGIILLVFLIVCANIYLKYLKTGTIAGVMKQIAIVHLEALASQDLIRSSLKRVGLTVQETLEGIYVSCKNLPTEENNLFIKCIQEFLNPIENPRYLLIRTNRLGKVINQTDYFAIPAILSNNKKCVDIFARLWEKYIGGSYKIVYTRNLEGRMTLLQARKNSFSATKRPKSKRLSKWQ